MCTKLNLHINYFEIMNSNDFLKRSIIQATEIRYERIFSYITAWYFIGYY